MSARSASLSHVFSCTDALYASLGRGAPAVQVDAYVVRLHEMSRRYGALALELRAQLAGEAPAPLAIIDQLMTRAFEADATGAMALYAVSMVVGPRLLVTVRDARALDPHDQEFQGLLDRVAATTVAEIHLIAGLKGPPEVVEDPRWHAGARALVDLADSSGNAESFVAPR